MSTPVKITRDPGAADGEAFDVVIAGGGIYGALSAVESAVRGLRTLLVERADFGAGTSFNNLRTIHGGLRYLQTLDILRARRSNRQRAWWLAHFPDLVVPIACLMPLHGRGLRRPGMFRAAFAISRLLKLDAGGPRGVELPLGAPRLLSVENVLDLAPSVLQPRLQGGALWSDAFIADSPRVIVETLRWAVGAGASVLNYAELTGAEGAHSGRSRLRIRDRIAGEEFSVTARHVVNATGPDLDVVARRLGAHDKDLLVPTIAWNLLFDARPPSGCSLAVSPPRHGARTYFVHPFHGRVLAGTGHAPHPGAPAGFDPSEDMLHAMRTDLDAALPGAGLGEARVLRVMAGILPGVRPASDLLAMRPLIRRRAMPGGATLWSVLGVKFTEAPEIARRLMDAVSGAVRGALPDRPAAARGWDVLDGAQPVSRESLLELAAAESAMCVEDLVERRTNAWCDPDARQRIETSVGDGLGRHAA
jgi:glycerol-3-phosphate dehydrogenase